MQLHSLTVVPLTDQAFQVYWSCRMGRATRGCQLLKGVSSHNLPAFEVALCTLHDDLYCGNLTPRITQDVASNGINNHFYFLIFPALQCIYSFVVVGSLHAHVMLYSDLDRLVLDYLVVEGYKNAAVSFSRESGMPAINCETMDQRTAIRNAICRGDVEAAIEQLNDLDSEVNSRSLSFLPFFCLL